MERIKSREIITRMGIKLEELEKLAAENNLKINVYGLPAISSYSFSNNHLKYKTFLTQEMMKKGFQKH